MSPAGSRSGGNAPQSAGRRLRAVRERLFVGLQTVLPQHPLSRLVHRLTRLPAGPVTHLAVRAFVRAYGVDLHEAAQPAASAYRTFNDFFTRALRADARPLDPRPKALLAPADARISEIGSLTGGRLLQAKGQSFDVQALLGGDPSLAATFADGAFATLYLAPRDYHRVHMPVSGRLRSAFHVPGRLFSVNPVTAARVPRLYARNERVVTLFDTAAGPLAVVLVGAIFVGGIATVWQGQVTPPRGRRLQHLQLPTPAPTLARGAELGRFDMGSTVILLLPRGSVTWLPEQTAGQRVCMGTALGLLTASPAS
ncbi:archaetidylserine decarboxylase [Thiohalocapsa halophila]